MFENIWILLLLVLFFGYIAGIVSMALISTGKTEDMVRQNLLIMEDNGDKSN